MDNQQPGVTVIEKALALAQAPARSAVPLFIGYTERGPSFELREVASAEAWAEVFGGPGEGAVTGAGGVSALCRAVRHYFDGAGAGAFVLSLGTQAEGAARGGEALLAALSDRRLYWALERELRITLVAVPDLVLLSDTDLGAWHDGWQAVLDLCGCRRGLFGLLDAPDDSQAALQCLGTFTGTGREAGAAYWPRLSVRDQDRAAVIPASAAVAAAIERVDRQFGIWTPPANVALDHVIGPTRSHVDVEDAWVQGGASFNLIRAFPGRGTRIWGCRTLSTDIRSPGRYVQVRRLLLYVESHLRQLSEMFVFEPNNEITWFKLKGQVTNWLRELWMQGGLFGAEEEQAFEVLVGLDETMTQAEVNAGLMVLRVRLCALYPAEFIELTLQFDMNAAASPAAA